MDIRQLRYFLAIVEEGSFSRAATRVNVAQPSLSIHIRKMEERLGTPLLLRGAHGVTPTEAGEVLAARARLMLADMAQTEEEIRSLGREPSGTVRVGLSGTISGILAVPLIARMHRDFPRIKPIITEAMSGFIKEWLAEGRIDLAVLYTELRETGLHSEPLLEEELVLLMPPGAAAEKPLEWLAAHPLILPSGAHGLRAMLDHWLREWGIAAEPAMEVDSYGAIKDLVAGGYGGSVLPYHAVAPEEAEGRLRIARFTAPRLWRSAHLAHASARPLTRAASAVRETLRVVAAELVESGAWAGARQSGADG